MIANKTFLFNLTSASQSTNQRHKITDNIRVRHLLKDIIAISQTGSLSVLTESRRDKMLKITLPPLEPRRLHGPNVNAAQMMLSGSLRFYEDNRSVMLHFCDISAALTFWLHTCEAKPQLYG